MKRLAVSVCGLGLLAVSVIAADDPLTEEDIVRMFIAGRPASEMIAEIDSREVAFTLDPEMLGELAAAGLPADVIEAMRRRQAELDAPRAPPEPEPAAVAPEAEVPAAEEAPTLRVRLEPRDPGAAADAEAEGPAPLVYPAVLVDPEMASAHGLGADRENWQVTDLAVFLACTTADHVPDQWRSRSALGRDFVLMPRHRLLALVSDSVRIEKKDRLETLRKLLGADLEQVHTEFRELALPDSLSAVVEPGVAHDLAFGIAAKVGGRYLVLTLEQQPGVVPPPAGVELSAAAWCRPKRGGVDLGIRFGD
jgi:hypothetical protein